MKKIILPLVFLIIFIINIVNNISALEIGISPASLNFDVNPGETVCKDIILYSSQNVILIGEDRWSRTNSKNLRDYSISFKSSEVILDYPKEISVNQKKQISLCISGNKPGNYYGSLIYNTEKLASVGIWINLKISGEVDETQKNNYSENNFIQITGKVVNNLNNSSSRIWLFLPTLFLIIILICLIYFLRKKQMKNI